MENQRFLTLLAGENISIVKDTPGVTRDRIYADVEWLNYQSHSSTPAGSSRGPTSDFKADALQAQLAIDSADVIVLVCDLRSGVTASDADVAAMLHDATDIYKEDELAFKLRQMHLVNQSLRESSGSLVVPSAYAEGFVEKLPAKAAPTHE